MQLFQLLSKLSIRKSIQVFQLIASYYLSRIVHNPFHWGMPISVSIEPTTSCNLGCTECPSGIKQFSRDTGSINIQFYKNIINNLSPDLLYLTFYFQGEPFLHSQFLEMVSYASEKNIYTSTSTNAHFLSDTSAKATVESGLNRLIISIDGVTQDSYESYRKKGNIDKVMQGTKNIIRWKKQLQSKTPYIVFQFLILRSNEHQIKEAKKLAKQLGVNQIVFKTAQLNDYENGHPLIPSIDKYSRYKQQKDGTFKIKNAFANRCWRMWSSCVITWDGLVVPCCFDKDAKHIMGDLKKNTFKEIWTGELYHQFRLKLLKSRKGIDICTNCTEGTTIFQH